MDKINQTPHDALCDSAAAVPWHVVATHFLAWLAN
jgi:hypothetical protein